MKLEKHIVLASALLLASAWPAVAQVEKVVIRTTGISCGACAAVSEINFKRMSVIDKVTISLSKEAILLTYKPGATFDPRQIREVLRPLEVGVVQFQIDARGRVEQQGGKRFFVAGKDKFVLAPAGNALTIPPGTPIVIEGTIDDRADPMKVEILNFRPLKQSGRAASLVGQNKDVIAVQNREQKAPGKTSGVVKNPDEDGRIQGDLHL